MRNLRPTLLILAVVVIAGCTGGAQEAGTQAPGITQATATPSSTAGSTPVMTSASTPIPGPTTGEADISVTKQIVHAGPVIASRALYEVIVEVKNSGSGWADMVRGESDFTVYDKDGGVTTAASFGYAYPRYLGPGETGYLMVQGGVDGVNPDAFFKVLADVHYKPVEQPGPTLTTDKISLNADPYGGTVNATGTITNPSTVDINSVVVGVIMFDSAGNPLTFDYTNIVKNIGAGQT
ncbi:MAG TPA: hypothetical protein VF375_04320, partial [Candidatus Limnocylindrales bacterium]